MMSEQWAQWNLYEHVDIFSNKVHMKMLSAKRRPFYPDFNG